MGGVRCGVLGGVLGSRKSGLAFPGNGNKPLKPPATRPNFWFGRLVRQVTKFVRKFAVLAGRAGIPGFAHATAEKQNQKSFSRWRVKTHKKTQKHPQKTTTKTPKNTQKHTKNTPKPKKKIALTRERKNLSRQKKIYFPPHPKWNKTKKNPALLADHSQGHSALSPRSPGSAPPPGV